MRDLKSSVSLWHWVSQRHSPCASLCGEKENRKWEQQEALLGSPGSSVEKHIWNISSKVITTGKKIQHNKAIAYKSELNFWRQLYRWGLPRWFNGKEPACQRRRRRRPGLDSWVGKIPCWRAWYPTPVFLPGQSHPWTEEPGGLQSTGSQELGTTEATWAGTHPHTRLTETHTYTSQEPKWTK